MDELLEKKITIKEGFNLGIISGRILSDFDMWTRVQMMKETEKIPTTHAVEKVAEMCKVSERNVWYSYSFTAKLLAVK